MNWPHNQPQSEKVSVSILICTANRAEQLRQTLLRLDTVRVPAETPAELIVVDNGSGEATAEVVRTARLANMPLYYLRESRRGKSYALATGMTAAKGSILMTTDDDVHPPENWIEEMCKPILTGKAHAVCGGVKLARHLVRPWMTEEHHGWLVSSEFAKPEEITSASLIGANMAFSKEILSKIPAFDPELGPGAMGFAEDSLFALQLHEAGYKIALALNVMVEHHFDEVRLSRQSFLKRRQNEGRVAAYVRHHWLHETITFPRMRLLKHALELALLRILRRRECQAEHGCPGWEMALESDVAFFKQYIFEQKRPRNYALRGLIRLDMDRSGSAARVEENISSVLNADSSCGSTMIAS